MDKVKVKIISSLSTESLERDIERWLNKLQETSVIIEIKFGGCGGFCSTSYGGYYEYSAMIIYQES